MSVTPEEKAAIDKWLSENEPRKYPVGYSAIYDEFGRPRNSLKFNLASLAKRIRRVHGYEGMSAKRLSEVLDRTESDTIAACDRHNIKIGEAK